MQRISPIFFLLFSIALFSCNKTSTHEGVSIELAQERGKQISGIAYNLTFNIPANIEQNITGTVDILFYLESKNDVVLDFRNNSEDAILGVWKNGKTIHFDFENGHIVIPKRYLKIGDNSITIGFTSANGSLNRSSEFLYTLFVPDRASTVFPCFDQPDLKAQFKLLLNIPAKWTALSNGKTDSIQYINNNIKSIYFTKTKPISTYLFAFATGDFRVETKTVLGKTFTLYHRETDTEKLNRNLPVLFNLHAQSLAWLEEYTGIEYPFNKLDFILIPGFQYSGMEHPGAIYYRDSRLLLDSDPSPTQKLQQANLIAHEVSHQWFGNLVTMKWFNDVWLKEVFAGFMADLIVNPQYPDINHDLSFVLSHFPRSYSVDRTKDANPIVQPLDNMLNAGTLYGDIIYHKAPIMMRQLEQIMGKDAFKEGVREYLNTFSMGNATWDELVTILNKHTDNDLVEWSQIWTKETGRPMIGYKINVNEKQICLNPLDSIHTPPMWVEILEAKTGSKSIWIDKLPLSITIDNLGKEDELLVNSSGMAYGCFVPNDLTTESIRKQINGIISPTGRASFYVTLYELLLDGKIAATDYIKLMTEQVAKEKEPQLVTYLLGQINTVFWRFTDEQIREQLSGVIENTLWQMLQSSITVEQKKPVLSCLTSVFNTNETFSRLYSGWTNQSVLGINLSEKERTNLAYELMIRRPELFHTIALGEIERINNPDRVAQFEFTLRAVSPNPSERIAFFESLKTATNRKPEPWVTESLHWLHHPLRSDFSIRFIEPSLNLLPEIQSTGDIFFPKSWLDATLWGHSSEDACNIVNQWIESKKDLSPSLRQKLLQSADMLFRISSKKKSGL
ncbi:MAG: M1 family aminopeptidase [Tenuifilaceae bacterium]|nr:M1 family aminopeptidase [Tenuifilaceae bacterium]